MYKRQLHTYSGYEEKVKKDLLSRAQSMGMQNYIFRVIVPEEQKTETVRGKKQEVDEKVFPGYVLVEMVMTDESWYVVRNTPNVTGFVGSHGGGSKPSPLYLSLIHILKNELGLFENPYFGISEEKESNKNVSLSNRKLARKLATESLVLLKNKNGAPVSYTHLETINQ